MKIKKTTSIILAGMLLLSLSACATQEEQKVITKEPEGKITIVDSGNQETQEPVISVEKIERLDENIMISDWLDEETAIVSNENIALGKMTIEEFEGAYPTSLYYYNISSKEFTPIKEQANVLLGGGTLSADKKFILYSEYVLGDPSYHILNLDTKESFCIMDDNIGCARGGEWFGNEVIGSTDEGKVYTATPTGGLALLEGLEGETAYVQCETTDYVYYTVQDASFMKMNRATREKTSLNIEHVIDATLSPDGTKMLVLQEYNEKDTFLLVDLVDGKQLTIAEGPEIRGISWSPDQRMIAYTIQGDETNATANGLYVYDMLSAKATKIAVDVHYAYTSWSPLGDKLMFSDWDREKYENSIIYLNSTIENQAK